MVRRADRDKWGTVAMLVAGAVVAVPVLYSLLFGVARLDISRDAVPGLSAFLVPLIIPVVALSFAVRRVTRTPSWWVVPLAAWIVVVPLTVIALLARAWIGS